MLWGGEQYFISPTSEGCGCKRSECRGRRLDSPLKIRLQAVLEEGGCVHAFSCYAVGEGMLNTDKNLLEY